MLLISLGGDEPVDLDLKSLPYPMGSRNGLKIVLRVPIRVINDNNPGFGEIDAQSSGPRGQQKYAELVILIEPLDTDGSVLTLDCTCQDLVPDLLVHEIVLDDICHAFELRKY